MKTISLYPTNSLNLADKWLRKIMEHAVPAGRYTQLPESDVLPTEEDCLPLIAWLLCVHVAERLYPSGHNIGASSGMSWSVCTAVKTAQAMAKFAASSSNLANFIKPDEAYLILDSGDNMLHAAPISRNAVKLFDKEVEMVLVAGCRKAVRAFKEREPFLNALGAELEIKDEINNIEWEALWNQYPARVVDDAEVNAAMQMHFPSVAA